MNALNDFIKAELRQRKQDYLSSPTYILEHYNTEQQNIEAYNGRQLLEMLQNANDAAEEASDKTIQIRLSGDELTIANNGESFTIDGIRSILYIAVSSKTKQRNKIGHKGLGFRSILSWADQVTIYSGGAQVCFSQNDAKHFLDDLIVSDPSIKDFLTKRSEAAIPIATLRVPKLIEEGLPNNSIFDTVISIKLKPSVLSDVRSQVDNLLNKETLVFLNHTDCIQIQHENKHIVYTKTTPENNLVTISAHDLLTGMQDSKTWYVVKETGKHKEKNYELAVAYTKELNDRENILYSYFKTEVKLPFPALVHGTFELTQNRNYLEKDTAGHNEFLTGRLANLLVEAALKIAEQEVSYLPLKLLNIDFDNVDSVLQSYDLENKLIQKVKESEVFPNVNGGYLAYKDEPVFYKDPIANLLSGTDVDDLMLPCHDLSVVNFIEQIGTYQYNVSQFISIISSRIYDFSFADLAQSVHFLLTSYQKEIGAADFDVAQYQPILLDAENEIITADSYIFVQPPDGADLTLPKFLKVKFLHPELFSEFARIFEASGSANMMQILKPLGIMEYSFTQISETIVHHYREKTGCTKSDVVQLHTHLFKLYRRELKGNDPGRFHVTDTPIITLKDKVIPASSVYFGSAYHNPLAQELYSFDKNKILASPEQFNLTARNTELLTSYFSWLGISMTPRYRSRKCPSVHSEAYLDHILRSQKYPCNHWNWSFKNFTELFEWLPNGLKISVMEFDEIEQILKRGKIAHLIKWIDTDAKLKATLEKDREINSESYLSFFKNVSRTLDYTKMPSYTKWLFSQAPFLPVESGAKKAPPGKCCLSKTITADFSPFVEKPKVPIGAIANKLEVPETTIEGYLAFLGVHKEISSFSLAALYQVLNSLPEADKTGRVARKIYREIINNFDVGRIDDTHPEYKKFAASGRMLARKGNVIDYYLVGQTYYLPTKIYGGNVLKRFALAEIDSKQSVPRIEKLLGIKQLKGVKFTVAGNPKLSVLYEQFHDEIEKFKALVYVLRKDKDTNHEIVNRLKRLNIFLAVDLKAVFSYQNTTEEFDLEVFEHVGTGKRGEFFISVPENALSLEELRESNKFCQSISEIFSSLIDTTEYTDFIHDLYSKNVAGRESRLLSYIQKDDSYDLDEAKRLLNIVEDIRFSFWKAFSYAKYNKSRLDNQLGKNLEDLLESKLKISRESIERLSNEVLENLQDRDNQSLVYDLFMMYDINFTVFSRHFFSLDFYAFFRDKMEELKSMLRSNFVSALYHSLKKLDINAKTKFFEHLDKYNRFSYSREMGFISACPKYFDDHIKSSFNLDIKSINEKIDYDENIRNSLSQLASIQIIVPEQLKINKVFQSLLVFGEFEELKNRIETFNNKNNQGGSGDSASSVEVGGKNIDYSSFDELAKKLTADLDFTKIKVKKATTVAHADSTGVHGGQGGSGGTRSIRFDKSAEELAGFIAELICYHALVAEHGPDQVRWISENAFRAYPDRFTTAEAGSGYDLELTENGKIRYIEIKGTANIEKGIQMSKGEMKLAIELQDRYDLMIVENLKGSNPSIRHIRSPFKFKKEETLFNNSKLKVFNDNYIIKFTWENSR